MFITKRDFWFLNNVCFDPGISFPERMLLLRPCNQPSGHPFGKIGRASVDVPRVQRVPRNRRFLVDLPLLSPRGKGALGSQRLFARGLVRILLPNPNLVWSHPKILGLRRVLRVTLVMKSPLNLKLWHMDAAGADMPRRVVRHVRTQTFVLEPVATWAKLELTFGGRHPDVWFCFSWRLFKNGSWTP